MSNNLKTWERNKVICKTIFPLNKKSVFLYVPHIMILNVIQTNGNASGRLRYLLQPMSHHIKGAKGERDG